MSVYRIRVSLDPRYSQHADAIQILESLPSYRRNDFIASCILKYRDTSEIIKEIQKLQFSVPTTLTSTSENDPPEIPESFLSFMDTL